MKTDVEGTVAQVGEIGYKFVEAAGYSNGQFYGMSPEDFKELCEENGLQFLGSHTGQDVPDSGKVGQPWHGGMKPYRLMPMPVWNG
jgi:sugar phosphate isomerase/epimerase